jgi:putative FmdB family regulatory protein
MPIYTYQCDHCGVRFERQQSFSDPVLKQCPECLEEALRKVYTPVGIVFKGSGFYSTDNRSPSGTRPKKEKTTSDTSKKEKTEVKDKKDKIPKKTKEEKST